MPRRFDDDPGAWALVAREYIMRKPPWLTLRRDHLRLPSGAEIENYWIQEFPAWVNVVAVTRQDEIVLVRQYRPGLGEVHYELPAGSTDPGEDGMQGFERAARRELLEETGYGEGTWSPLMQLSANPALQTNLTYSFVAEGVEAIAEPRPEATEDIRVHRVPVREVRTLLAEGEVVQALHAAPLLHYLLGRFAS